MTKPAHLKTARDFSHLLDSAFRVPGTRFRFGLDPLLGLLPGIGDMIGGAFSGYLLWIGVRAGAPLPVLLRMLGNVGIDALVGAVPLVGDLFDAGMKANNRNLALIEGYLEAPEEVTARSKLLLVLLLILLAAFLIGALWITVLIIAWIGGLFT